MYLKDLQGLFWTAGHATILEMVKTVFGNGRQLNCFHMSGLCLYDCSNKINGCGLNGKQMK